MNIHEYQAKKLLKLYGAPVSNGVIVKSLDEIDEKIKDLKKGEYVLKAQIHAGGRGKAGGVKLVKDIKELKEQAKKMLGKKLITHQTGPEGRVVKTLYIEESSNIHKEFYLSCLIDRQASKIAFICSTEGGMDIEKVAEENPKKIFTSKFNITDNLEENELNKLIKIFNLDENQKLEAKKLLVSIYKILIEKDASLIEINPLIINKEKKNSLFRCKNDV